MIKPSEIISGSRLLEVVQSEYNGELSVIKSLAWGTYIQGGGLTQSGGIAHDIWKKPLKKLSISNFQFSNILLLGLGGGGLIKILDKHWPDAMVTGVDIDPVIVELGKKYLGLDEERVEIIIEDAYEYVEKISNIKFPTFAKDMAGKQISNAKDQNKTAKSKRQMVNGNKFDLILVDLYVGDEFPEKFETEKYIQLVRSLLSRSGMAVFNRLYYDRKRPIAMKFLKKLEKNFKTVDVVYPEANVMFLCKGQKLLSFTC